jgi:hypothetical protein
MSFNTAQNVLWMETYQLHAGRHCASSSNKISIIYERTCRVNKIVTFLVTRISEALNLTFSKAPAALQQRNLD